MEQVVILRQCTKYFTAIVDYAIGCRPAHAAAAQRMDGKQGAALGRQQEVHRFGQHLPERIGQNGAVGARAGAGLFALCQAGEQTYLARKQRPIAQLGPAHADRAIAAVVVLAADEFKRAIEALVLPDAIVAHHGQDRAVTELVLIHRARVALIRQAGMRARIFPAEFVQGVRGGDHLLEQAPQWSRYRQVFNQQAAWCCGKVDHAGDGGPHPTRAQRLRFIGKTVDQVRSVVRDGDHVAIA